MSFIYNAENYILKHRIELGDVLGVPEDEEQPWVELREPDSSDLFQASHIIQTADNAAKITTIAELFPKVLIDHNLEIEPGKKHPDEVVIHLLQNRPKVTLKAATEYGEKVLFLLLADQKVKKSKGE